MVSVPYITFDLIMLTCYYKCMERRNHYEKNN